MKTKLLTTMRVVLCLMRGSVDWWYDPRRNNKPMLRTRTGRLFDTARISNGWLLTERKQVET